MRVLVVEGEPAVRHLVDRVLTARGHFVLIAPSMFEAFALTLDFPESIDIALLDVLTPGMGGLTYMDHLKRQFPAVRIVLMIARNDVSRVPSTAPLLFKPFTPQSLISIAESA
jgi:DNA-binding response OmpR family regulator